MLASMCIKYCYFYTDITFAITNLSSIAATFQFEEPKGEGAVKILNKPNTVDGNGAKDAFKVSKIGIMTGCLTF